MDEAYSVGIRLVLDDAVTPALATMAQSLAAADAAMSARLPGVAQPSPVRPAQPTPPADPPTMQAPTRESPITTTPSWERIAPQIPGLPPIASPAPPATPIQALPAIARTPSVADAPQAQAAAPLTLVQHLMAFATPALGQLNLPEMPVLLPPALPASLATPAPLLAPPAPALPDWTISMAPPQQASLAAAPLAAPGTAAPLQEQPAPVRTATAEAPARSEPAQRGGNGPIGGDVILDGMRVGRWLARELGRMADTPQAGTTFFDPRAGATWPGTLQGEAAR